MRGVLLALKAGSIGSDPTPRDGWNRAGPGLTVTGNGRDGQAAWSRRSPCRSTRSADPAARRSRGGCAPAGAVSRSRRCSTAGPARGYRCYLELRGDDGATYILWHEEAGDRRELVQFIRAGMAG